MCILRLKSSSNSTTPPRWILATAAAALVMVTGCSHTSQVQTDPPGAKVSKDGRPLGVTPMEVPIEVGPFTGNQTITVEKRGVSRTVQFENDQFMWPIFLIGAGTGALSSMAIAGFGASLLSTNALLANTMLILAPVPLITTPLVYFFFYAWRMPERVTIDLKGKQVFTSPTGNFQVLSAEGSTKKKKRRKKRKKRKEPVIEEYGTVDDLDHEGGEKSRIPVDDRDDEDAPSRRLISDDDQRDAAPKAKDGESGGPCYGNNTCNDGLSCTDGTCRAAETGTLGGACYGNHTCNDDMVCDAGTCIPAEE